MTIGNGHVSIKEGEVAIRSFYDEAGEVVRDVLGSFGSSPEKAAELDLELGLEEALEPVVCPQEACRRIAILAALVEKYETAKRSGLLAAIEQHAATASVTLVNLERGLTGSPDHDDRRETIFVIRTAVAAAMEEAVAIKESKLRQRVIGLITPIIDRK